MGVGGVGGWVGVVVGGVEDIGVLGYLAVYCLFQGHAVCDLNIAF